MENKSPLSLATEYYLAAVKTGKMPPKSFDDELGALIQEEAAALRLEALRINATYGTHLKLAE